MNGTVVAKQLMQEEGSRGTVYQDTLGFWTIGIGRLVDARKAGAGLSTEEVQYLLQNDIKKIETHLDAAIPWWRELNEPRQAVILGMAFQLGINGLLQFTNTLAAVRYGNFQGAHDGILNSKWAKQTPGRAERMALQMLTGQWQAKEGFTLP